MTFSQIKTQKLFVVYLEAFEATSHLFHAAWTKVAAPKTKIYENFPSPAFSSASGINRSGPKTRSGPVGR
jgi:hypothetical protein